MGSMRSALNELEKDMAAASESNARLGIKPGMSVTVTGDVYWSPKVWRVDGKRATVVDPWYPSTALVRFQDGTEGYVAKAALKMEESEP
jgi:hypothetical protein